MKKVLLGMIACLICVGFAVGISVFAVACDKKNPQSDNKKSASSESNDSPADIEAMSHFKFETTDVNGTQGYCIAEYLGGDDDSVVIPSTFRGKNVIKIDPYVFREYENKNDIKSVTLPDTLKSIDVGAFENCTNLSTISIPDSVVYLGTSAFNGCTSLDLNTNDNAKYLGNEEHPYIALVGATSSDIVSCDIEITTCFILDGAFEDCEDLTSIEITGAVKSIGDSAFSGCSNLSELTISNSVEYIGESAFRYCTKLESVDTGSGVKGIYAYAFANCDSLSSVKIGGSVNTMDNNVFYNCLKLVHVTLLSDAFIEYSMYFPTTNIGFELKTTENGTWNNSISIQSSYSTLLVGSDKYLYAYYGTGASSFTVPSDCTKIYSSAFKNSNLSEVTITNVDFIGESAFQNCKSLIEVKSFNNVTNIEDSAFEGCNKLRNTPFGDDILTIGKKSFKGCEWLTEVSIPNGINSVGNYAFDECIRLVHLKDLSGQNLLSSLAFYDIIYDNFGLEVLTESEGVWKNILSVVEGYLYYTVTTYDSESRDADKNGKYVMGYLGNLTSLEYTVPESCNKILNYAFRGDTRLKSLIIHDEVTSIIKEYEFNGCTSLTEVVIGDGMEKIGSFAFIGCSSLKSVIIGDNIDIYENAFVNLTSLEYVNLGAGTNFYEFTNSSYCFIGCTSLKFVVLNSLNYFNAIYDLKSLSGLIEYADIIYSCNNTANDAEFSEWFKQNYTHHYVDQVSEMTPLEKTLPIYRKYTRNN